MVAVGEPHEVDFKDKGVCALLYALQLCASNTLFYDESVLISRDGSYQTVMSETMLRLYLERQHTKCMIESYIIWNMPERAQAFAMKVKQYVM